MAKKHQTIIHEWFEDVWNQGSAEAIDRLLDPETIVHGIAGNAGEVVKGPAGFKVFHKSFLDAFPDIKVQVLEVVVEGERMAARCLVTGTHTGAGLGFDPTGKPIEFSGMCIARVKNGKIVEAWNNFDFLTFYRQLDALKMMG